ncbi:MAG: hypothetical protein IKL50_08160 [Bacteroidales bacterium]|nr:hypothetical protein [Bacteroidales bacterium]
MKTNDNIQRYIREFIILNEDKLKTHTEWHISFDEIFSKAFSDEEIIQYLMENHIDFVEDRYGTKYYVSYIYPWREIYLLINPF